MPTPKTEADRALADFWRSYVESGRGGFGFVTRNPGEALRALRTIQQLPVVYPAKQSDSPGGRFIAQVLHAKGPGGFPARWWGSAVLPIPENPADSLKIPEAKRLRYTLRLAGKAGIICRPVPDAERHGFMERANDRDRNHTNAAYRVDEPRNDDLLDHDLWLVTEDSAGQPLHLAVVAVDGEFSVLRYFRTLGDTEDHSLSRYVAHYAAVQALSERGVRWLVDNEAPAAQTNGVRLFQRIVGFRYMRIRRPHGRGAAG